MAASLFTVPPTLESTVDVVLTSSDGAEFRAHKLFLAAASTAFESTFLLPTVAPALPVDADLPVVELVELGDVLTLVLSYIYPVDRPLPSSLNVLKGALRAAKKYDMPSVISGLRPHVLRSEYLETDPLAIFGIARLMGFEEESKIAYRKTFEADVSQLLSDASSAEDISGADFSLILKKRQSIAEAMTKRLREGAFFNMIYDFDSRQDDFDAPICMKESCERPYPWVILWVQLAAAELLKRPSTDMIFSSGFVQQIRTLVPKCTCGASNIAWEADKFLMLKDELDVRFQEMMDLETAA